MVPLVTTLRESEGREASPSAVIIDALGLLLGVIVHAADSIYGRIAVLIACFLLGLTLIIVRRIAGTTGFVVLPK